MATWKDCAPVSWVATAHNVPESISSKFVSAPADFPHFFPARGLSLRCTFSPFSQWLLVLTSLHGSSCCQLWKCLNKPILTEEPVPMDYILKKLIWTASVTSSTFEHPHYSPYLTVMNSCLFPKLNSPSKSKGVTLWSSWVSEVAQSHPTLRDPVDCSPPGSSVHGILQARILEWAAISFSRDLPDPGIEPRSPTLQADAGRRFNFWALKIHNCEWKIIENLGLLEVSQKDGVIPQTLF